MTADEFKAWLTTMKARGYNKSDCADLLGRKGPWVSVCQSKGSDRMTALACAAILAGLEPFTSARAVSSRPRSAHRVQP